MTKFKLASKKNPTKKDEPGKWYAHPVVENNLNTRAVCHAVTRNTTIAPTELETSFNLVCDGIPPLLQQGGSVRLGSLGTMRLSFGSDGVETIIAPQTGRRRLSRQKRLSRQSKSSK